MSKANKVPQGQLPLMASLSEISKSDEKSPPIEFGSSTEKAFFSQAMVAIVPKEMKGNKQVTQCINNIFGAYYGVVSARHVLAKAIFEFCNLTRCDYAEVAAAISTGLQRQLSTGYISKLYYAGHTLVSTPVASKIPDIEKLAMIGRLESSEMDVLSLENGQVKIGDKFIALLNRDALKSELSARYPTRFPAQAVKPWGIKGFLSHVNSAITANSKDAELLANLQQVKKLLEARIAILDKTEVKAVA